MTTIAAFYEALTGVVDHQPWRERAACKGLDPALFVMERGDNGGPAKAVCCECAVRSECLDYALTHNERLGIWGMTSERERKVMRRLEHTEKVRREHIGARLSGTHPRRNGAA